MIPAGSEPRVLVMGGTGFIGRRLVDALPPQWETVVVTRREVELPPHVRTASMPAGDRPLPTELERPFDVILHLAGNSNHALAETEPWNDLAATASPAAVVFGRVAARRIVVLSSAAVYAGLSGRVDPSVPLRPRMAYAASKQYVEALLDAAVASGRVGSGVVLRLYNAFGPGERATRLIPRVVEAASRGSTFTLTGSPDSLSDPVHVDRVVEVLVAAATSTVDGTFDLCGGDPVPLREQVGRIAEALALPPLHVEVIPRPGEFPIRFFSDPGPLSAAFGLPRPEPFADAVRRYRDEAGLLTPS